MTGRFHIIIDLKQVPTKILSDKEGLESFLESFPRKIGMNVLSEVCVVEGIPQNPGLSGFVLIDFSHISVHTFTKSSEALVDIFSCKGYDEKLAQIEVLDYFQVPKSHSRIKRVYWG